MLPQVLLPSVTTLRKKRHLPPVLHRNRNSCGFRTAQLSPAAYVRDFRSDWVHRINCPPAVGDRSEPLSVQRGGGASNSMHQMNRIFAAHLNSRLPSCTCSGRSGSRGRCQFGRNGYLPTKATCGLLASPERRLHGFLNPVLAIRWSPGNLKSSAPSCKCFQVRALRIDRAYLGLDGASRPRTRGYWQNSVSDFSLRGEESAKERGELIMRQPEHPKKPTRGFIAEMSGEIRDKWN